MKKQTTRIYVFILSCWLFGNVTATGQTIEKNILSTFENEVLVEINLARSQPETYVAILQEWKKNYRGNELHLPNRTPVVTKEGAVLVDEAIEFLRALKASGAVALQKSLAAAAKVQLLDMQKSGVRGHRGSDGSLPPDRLGRFGQTGGEIGELIAYRSQTAREIVIKLILDDGNTGRGHRQRLFKQDFKLIGLAAGESAKLGNLCVLVLAQDFTETP